MDTFVDALPTAKFSSNGAPLGSCDGPDRSRQHQHGGREHDFDDGE
jgi:hypothetical protein